MHLSGEQKIHYTLRIAVAMCFIGHGAFGIITKPVWCNYFALFGISSHTAFQLMPILGTFDILLGICMLFYAVRIIPAWLFFWGIVTALLRPLSGEPFAEFVERAGNFGAPFALLILHGGWPRRFRDWFKPLRPADIHTDPKTRAAVITCLRVIVFLLLAGHGWMNLLEKKGLISQYSNLGFSNPAILAKALGIFEIISAVAVLIRPSRPLILILLVWKVSSELFYPHHELFEWVERGGSYGALLALWFALNGNPGGLLKNKFRKAGLLVAMFPFIPF